MPFTVEEFSDLVRLLEERPEWRVELRRLVLTDELLSLPGLVRDLAEAQRRTEERIDQLAQRMDQLAQRMDQLAQRMDQLTRDVQQLTEVLLRMGVDVDRLKGYMMEARYLSHGHAYFSRVVRRAHVLSGDELNALLDQGRFSREEAEEILQADVVVRGRRWEDGAEVYLVVEVSWGIGISDVQRASDRAVLLARTGTPTIPVVAGSWVSPEAQEPARALRVWQVTDGRVSPPETA